MNIMKRSSLFTGIGFALLLGVSTHANSDTKENTNTSTHTNTNISTSTASPSTSTNTNTNINTHSKTNTNTYTNKNKNINDKTVPLKTLLQPVTSLSANFEQELLNPQGKMMQEVKGQMWLKKPGQFRWEIQGKDARLVVSNGKQVWDYDKDLEQVTIQKISKGESKAPIFFLTGDVESLEKDFKINNFTERNKPCMRAGSQMCYELTPKSEQAPFQKIDIGFKEGVLNELIMVDQLGQTSFFKFTQTKLNPPVAANLFQFVPPKGIDVVGD